jgi:hypothetical protein
VIAEAAQYRIGEANGGTRHVADDIRVRVKIVLSSGGAGGINRGSRVFARAPIPCAPPARCHSTEEMTLKFRLAIAALAALVTLPAVAQETYVIDPVHSQPQWVATHIGFSNQHGNFGKATGKIVLDRAAKKGSIDVSIDTTSIRTYSDRSIRSSRRRFLSKNSRR